MKHHTAKRLLQETPLSVTDAVRLILEGMEELGERAAGLARGDCLKLLRRVLREGVAAVEAAERTVTLEEAAWHSVEARKGRRPVTLRDLRHYVRRILRVDGAGQMMLRRMTAGDCRRILQTAFGNSPSSYKKGRAILHSIFAHGMRHEWADANPVDKIDVPHIKETPIRPLSLEEVERLRRTAQRPEHRDMELPLHLMLYCGIRPTEVQRLRTEDIDWKHRQVIIRPQTSKTGGGRVVPLRIRRNINRALPNRSTWERRWQHLRRSAGFTRWVPDVCRHTFASYHAAHFRNLPALQLEMGHRDSGLLRSRYIGATEWGKAKGFWSE